MKKSSFKKMIPVNEDEFIQFREYQNKMAKLTQNELQTPSALSSLVHAQEEKSQLLHDPSDNAERQENQLVHLNHMIRRLEDKLDTRTSPLPPPPPPPPQPQTEISDFDLKALPSANAKNRARQLLRDLGPSTWSSTGELISNGQTIPGSNKNELVKYLVTDWRNMFKDNPPEGSKEIQDLIKEKGITSDVLGLPLKQTTSRAVGFATTTPKTPIETVDLRRSTPRRKTRAKQVANIERGKEILANQKEFTNFMK